MAKPKTSRNSKKNGDSSSQLTSDNGFQTPAGDSLISAVSENKKNVIPINLDDEIRRRAYELFQERGGIPGSEHEDWLRAEREVLARYQQTA